MSTGSKKKRRIDRVTSLEMPPGVWGTLWDNLRRGYVLVRLALCALAALLLWVITAGWAPPFPYHWGDVLPRDIVARTQFERPDEEATRKARDQARGLAIAIYDQDPTQLEQLRAKIENDVTQLLAAESYEDAQAIWEQFRLQLAEGTPQPTEEERRERFQRFRDSLSAEGALDAFKTALAESLAPLKQKGLLQKLPPEHDANAETITVRRAGEDRFEQNVPISDVLVENAAAALQKSLQQKLPDVADRVFAALRRQLPETLKLNLEATRAAAERCGGGRHGTNGADLGRHGPGACQRRKRRSVTDQRHDAAKIASGIPGRTSSAFVFIQSQPLARRAWNVRRVVCSLRLLHLSPRAAGYRRPWSSGNAVGARRGHRRAHGVHEPRRMASGADPAHALRHDHGHRIPAGNCFVALGGVLP